MMRRLSLLLIFAVAVTVCGFAQEHEHESAAMKSGFDKAIMQQVWDAWATLNPANPAKFYGKEKAHVFYDVAPVKYQGWAEYEAGVKPMLASWKSMKAKVNYDGQIREETPNMVWTATTVDLEYVDKDGKEMKAPVRWTAIWHKHGANWVIAHEHVSVPMQ